MNHNFIYSTSTEALPGLLHRVMTMGDETGSRDGRTMELTHVGITLTEPWKRELLVPERKPNLAAQIAETMWVLSGRDDVEWLSHYLPRAPLFSDDGLRWRGAYGPRLRSWAGDIDQIAHVVETLRKSPLSRQAVAMIYDPAVDTEPGKDIPCNNWLSFSNRLGKLDLHVAIRSNDAMWGWSGINAFEWSALQEVVAYLVGVEVGRLHFSVTSFHLYDRHWTKANDIVRSADLWRGTEDLSESPRFNLDVAGLASTMASFDALATEWFVIEEALRHGKDMTEHIAQFPEPMLRSWLSVLAWWWSADATRLQPVAGTRLYAAARMALQPKPRDESAFLKHVNDLHAEKHSAYGNSWKRRGEMLGIMANIARKIDRLGATTSDETAADTAIDLLVYLAKYRWWLHDHRDEPAPFEWGGDASTILSDHVTPVSDLLRYIEKDEQGTLGQFDTSKLEAKLTDNFSQLENIAMTQDRPRHFMVDQMLADAYLLARTLWEKQ